MAENYSFTTPLLYDLFLDNVSLLSNVSIEDNGPNPRALWQLILFGTLLGALIITVLLGNLLVIVAVTTVRTLHTPTNMFILSLATTDFLLGCVVLPFSAVLTLHNEWPFGPIVCNIYNSSDVMLCTVSILNLFAISMERYYAVTKPMSYQRKMTVRLVVRFCIGIWLFSMLLGFLPIHLGLNTPDGRVQNYDHPKACVFESNIAFVLIDSLGTYFAPLIVMCVVYTKVLIITKRQVTEINKLRHLGSSTDPAHRRRRDKHSRLVSDTKATITLASLVLAFSICWIPYFVLFTAKPFLKQPVNIHLDLFVLWLGYTNSGINPFLYAYYNTTFRRAFAKILCRRKQNWWRDSSQDIVTSNFRRAGPDSILNSSEMSALNHNVNNGRHHHDPH